MGARVLVWGVVRKQNVKARLIHFRGPANFIDLDFLFEIQR